MARKEEGELGLSKSEMQIVFENQYAHALASRQSARPEIEAGLARIGIPPNEAKISSVFQIQWEANSQAILATVLVNNMKIMEQLKVANVNL